MKARIAAASAVPALVAAALGLSAGPALAGTHPRLAIESHRATSLTPAPARQVAENPVPVPWIADNPVPVPWLLDR